MWSLRDPGPETVNDVIDSLARRGRRRAVGYRGDFGVWWWSRRRLTDEVAARAAALADAGVAQGDRVVMWAEDGPEWVATAFGALRVGAVVVPVDISASPGLAGRVADEVQATLVVHGDDADAGPVAAPCRSVRSLGGGRLPRPALPPVGPDDPAFILFTSGTMGRPRGVVLSHGNVAAQVRGLWRWRHLLRFRSRTLLSLSPLSHVQGLVIGTIVPLAVGASVLWTGSTDPHHVIRSIRQNRVAALLAAPRVHAMVADELARSPSGRSGEPVGERTSGMRPFLRRRHHLFLATHRRLGYTFWVVLVGGATLPPAVERFWYDAGYVLVQGYGLTETAALVTLKINGPFQARLGSVGRPVSGHEVEIDGRGEMLVRGPAVAAGSWAGGRLVPRNEPVLRTGDLAGRRDDGDLVFRGRHGELIVTAEGLNIHAGDVEAVLRTVPGVSDAVVVETAPGARSEVHAVLLLDAGGDAAAAVAAANRRLERHERIASWSVWPDDDFPRSAMLKVRRAEVAATLGESADPDTDPPGPAQAGSTADGIGADVPNLDEIRSTPDRRRRLELLARHLSAADRPGSIPDAAAEATLLGDLGLSSLDIVELLSSLERDGVAATGDLVIAQGDSLAEVRRRIAGAGGERSQPGPAAPRMDRWWFRTGQELAGPPVRAVWARLVSRRTVVGVASLAGVSGPVIVACANHHHGADALVVSRSLPRRLRRRPLVVTTRWLFEDHLDADIADIAATPLRRTVVGGAYRLGMPMLFPYVVWPSHVVSRHGLLETGRLMGRGYRPIVFPERRLPPAPEGVQEVAVEAGVGVVAAETGATILPVRLVGNERISTTPRLRRPRVMVVFGPPLPVAPGEDPAQVTQRLASALAGL